VLVVVLLLVWLAALTPIAYRHYTDRQATVSVERFSYRTWLVRHANPAIGMIEFNSTSRSRVDRRLDVKMQIRNERRRIQHRRERRRRVLVVLVATIALSFVLGVVPALRMLWGLTFASSVLGAAYIYFLVSVARSETLNLERLRKIVPLGTEISGRSEPQTVGAERGVLYSTPLPRRPSFVVLEAQAR